MYADKSNENKYSSAKITAKAGFLIAGSLKDVRLHEKNADFFNTTPPFFFSFQSVKSLNSEAGGWYRYSVSSEYRVLPGFF